MFWFKRKAQREAEQKRLDVYRSMKHIVEVHIKEYEHPLRDGNLLRRDIELLKELVKDSDQAERDCGWLPYKNLLANPELAKTPKFK